MTKFRQRTINAVHVCVVKALVHSGGIPARELFGPPGSNQSGSGGNETAEASSVESR
jgi:hypothetical protein